MTYEVTLPFNDRDVFKQYITMKPKNAGVRIHILPDKTACLQLQYEHILGEGQIECTLMITATHEIVKCLTTRQDLGLKFTYGISFHLQNYFITSIQILIVVQLSEKPVKSIPCVLAVTP
jgi:hypothetical protein